VRCLFPPGLADQGAPKAWRASSKNRAERDVLDENSRNEILVIVLHPLLDHGNVRRLILAGLVFIPVILSTIRLSQIKDWAWPSVLLVAGILIFGIADRFWPHPVFAASRFGLLAAYFGLTAVGLFSYLRNADFITNSQLYTAISIYLLIGFLRFGLYSSITSLYPNAIVSSQHVISGRPSELLYFSLATLTTLGYGDVVAVNSEVRILAVLEAVTGVLYVAITVAVLVSSYGRQGSRSEPGPPST
jgi:hypothetical protein